MKKIYPFVFFLSASVLAFSNCGGGSKSSPPAKISLSNAAPVMGISAVAGNETVSIGWSDTADATSYAVYRSLSSGATGTQITSITTPGTSYLDAPLANNTSYYYTVCAESGSTQLGCSSQVSATPDPQSGSVTISGTIQYQDKEYGINGFTGSTPYKAVRYATVDLVSGGSPIMSTVTDSNGFYSITTSPTLTVYVRIETSAVPGSSSAEIAVKDFSGNIYAAASNDFQLSGSANVNISVPASSIGGAFNILDVFTNGFQFDYAMSGSYPGWNLYGFWQQNISNGTYYCSGGCSNGRGIYVYNSSTDTDEYDDDVLYHEFGHFTANYYSVDDSPGGTHMLTSNDLDLRLSWSEGWGDQMPGAVKMWLHANGRDNLLSSDNSIPLTGYVDTDSGGAKIAIDMDNPDSSYPYINPVYFSYASSEIAIAKILLDSNKNYGMNNVWSVITNFQANPASTPSNLELFRDRWSSLEPGSPIDSFLADRLIYYTADACEPDNSFAAAQAYAGPQTHYLFGAADADYISFPVTKGGSYTVTTSSLLNGADTLVAVYKSDQETVVGKNDNANGTVYSGNAWTYPGVPSDVYKSVCDGYGVCHENGGDILGSTVSFTAPSTGTYYVKVQSSSTRPVSAGRYGTYTLTIN